MMKKKLLITPEQEDRIVSVCKEVHGSLTPMRIRNWLENFDLEEIAIALRILEHIKYITLEEIIAEYDHFLSALLRSLPAPQRIFVHGPSAFGKSGSTMIYFLKQTMAYKDQEHRFKILSHSVKLRSQGLGEGSVLLLVDDIIGSGRSLETYYSQAIKSQLLKENYSLNLHVLCVAYMQGAREHLEKTIPHITLHGTQYIKAFASGTSVFGYRPRMLPVRHVCYEHGKRLFSKKNWKTGHLENHPLGFNNAQALLVFAHSVPNNSLPVLWSTKGGWTPLYPRSAEGKVSNLKQFQQETWLWISIAYKIGIFKKDAPHSIYTRNIDFSILAMVRLKKQRRIPPIICQLLGITARRYEDILEEGRRRHIFDAEGKLTQEGQVLYEQIQSSIKRHHLEGEKHQYDFNMAEPYIPKTFLGRT